MFPDLYHVINTSVFIFKFNESCSIPVACQMDLWLQTQVTSQAKTYTNGYPLKQLKPFRIRYNPF